MPVSSIEQKLRDLSQQEQTESDNGTGIEKSENTQEQECLTTTAQAKRLRKSTILLAVVFGIGLLCLLFMIKKSTPPAAAAAASPEEARIETAIAKLTGIKSEMLNRLDEVIDKFYELSSVQQVSVTELTKNPFKLELFTHNPGNLSDVEKDILDVNVELRQQQLQSQAQNLQLLSIMRSGRMDTKSCCMINDKIFYEGDTIKDFKINQIGDNYVKLESEGAEITLKLSE